MYYCYHVEGPSLRVRIAWSESERGNCKTARLEVKTEVLPTLQFCLELYLITVRLITSGPV